MSYITLKLCKVSIHIATNIINAAGNLLEHLEQFGFLDSMKKVMLWDRLFGRAKEIEFVVFDSTSRENELREKNWNMNLQKAYEKGNKLFMEGN